MLIRRRALVVLLACLAALAPWTTPVGLKASVELPAKLTDQEFWALTEEMSEPNGFFRSDNFLSNEMGYQTVIPELLNRAKPGGVYLGVGPEQNFPYIVALKPRMAFIIDIRRGNLHEQLLYKALFEMSADRAEFLSRLFSRKRPANLGTSASVGELFAAFQSVPASEETYKENMKTVTEWLTKKHQFKLTPEDIDGIEYVYHDAFFVGGPNLNYSMGSGSFGRGGNSPTYETLMLVTDGQGTNRGFLATEESFAYLKEFETKNLLVPLVGNFGGPKTIRAVAKYIKERGGVVSAFYLSNVEQYLNQDGLWGNFCSSVATLPLEEGSTFIYSGRGGPNQGVGSGRGGGGLQSAIRSILSDVKTCVAG